MKSKFISILKALPLIAISIYCYQVIKNGKFGTSILGIALILILFYNLIFNIIGLTMVITSNFLNLSPDSLVTDLSQFYYRSYYLFKTGGAVYSSWKIHIYLAVVSIIFGIMYNIDQKLS